MGLSITLCRVCRPLLPFCAGLCTLLSTSAIAQETLQMLTWRSYTAPEVLERFAEETGVAVELTIIDSNAELLETLQTSDIAFDIAVPSDSWVRILVDQDLLLDFDATRLESFARVDDVWVGPYFDPRQLYSIPLHWGTTSFAVNTDIVPPSDDLSLLFEPPEALRGKVGLLSDSRDVIELALKHLELPACTAEPEHLQALEELLVDLRDYLHGFRIQGMTDRLAAGEVAVQMIYNGAAMRTRLKNPAVRYIFPAEGVTVWSDNFVIPAASDAPELAMRFIDFFLRPENIALQSNMTRYGNAIGASRELMDEELREAPELMVPPGTPITYQQICEPEVLAHYGAIWDRLTAGAE